MQSDDKTQFLVRLHHLASRCVLEMEQSGPARGIIQHPKISQVHSLQHLGEDPMHGLHAWQKMARISAWTLHKKVFKLSGVLLLSTPSLQTQSRERCFLTLYENFEREIVDSAASPCMMVKVIYFQNSKK